MGASSSKTPTPTVTPSSQTYMPSIDPSRFATVPQEIVMKAQAELEQARQAAESSRLAAEASAAAALQKAGLYSTILWYIFYAVLGVGVIVALVYLVDYIGLKVSNKAPIGLLSSLNDATKSSVSSTTSTSNTTKSGVNNGTTSKKESFSLFESFESPGGYGISLWMFIKDWNYGYGTSSMLY